MYALKCIAAIIISLIAACQDYKYLKIKNYITFPGMLIGLIIAPIWKLENLGSSFLGIIIPFVVCQILRILNMLKAGDIKLLMAMGSIMGIRLGIWCMAFSMIAGGVISLIIMINKKIFAERFGVLSEYLKGIFWTMSIRKYPAENKESTAYMPFGVAIFFGVIMTYINDIYNII